MDRRAFLRWLGGAAAGVALAPSLDLERLLWIPGEKTIFIPPPPTLTPITITNQQTFMIGDVFTINGYYSEYWPNKSKTLQRFRVTGTSSAGIVNMEKSDPPILSRFKNWHHVSGQSR